MKHEDGEEIDRDSGHAPPCRSQLRLVPYRRESGPKPEPRAALVMNSRQSLAREEVAAQSQALREEDEYGDVQLLGGNSPSAG